MAFVQLLIHPSKKQAKLCAVSGRHLSLCFQDSQAYPRQKVFTIAELDQLVEDMTRLDYSQSDNEVRVER
jgi:hypothetical protein